MTADGPVDTYEDLSPTQVLVDWDALLDEGTFRLVGRPS